MGHKRDGEGRACRRAPVEDRHAQPRRWGKHSDLATCPKQRATQLNGGWSNRAQPGHPMQITRPRVAGSKSYLRAEASAQQNLVECARPLPNRLIRPQNSSQRFSDALATGLCLWPSPAPLGGDAMPAGYKPHSESHSLSRRSPHRPNRQSHGPRSHHQADFQSAINPVDTPP